MASSPAFTMGLSGVMSGSERYPPSLAKARTDSLARLLDTACLLEPPSPSSTPLSSKVWS